MALWADFDFGDGLTITTGATQPPKLGEKIVWDFYSKQGVHLLGKAMKCCEKGLGSVENLLNIHVNFKKKTGDFEFSFKLS